MWNIFVRQSDLFLLTNFFFTYNFGKDKNISNKTFELLLDISNHCSPHSLKELLLTCGEPFSNDEIKQTWKEATLEQGKFHYKPFVQMLKGKEDDAE